MAWTLLQEFADATVGYSSNTADVDIPVAITAGSLIVMGISSYGPSQNVSSITDNRGNTWTHVGSVVRSPGDDTLDVYYAKNAAAGATTVTITMAQVENIGASILEYSGGHTTSPLVANSSGTGTSSTSTSGSITPGVDGCLILAFGTDQRLATTTVTAGSGYTLRSMHGTADNSVRIYSEEKIQTTSAATTASFSIGTSTTWGIIIAAFQPAAAGTTPGSEAKAPGQINNINNTGNAWVDPSLGITSDNTYATFTASTTNTVSDYFQAINYGFSIPSTATITGYKVQIECKQSTQVFQIEDLYLEAYTGTNGSSNLNPSPNTTQVGTSDAIFSIGGDGQLFSCTYGPSDINRVDFGFSFVVRKASGSTSQTFSVDSCTLTVYYTTPSSGGPDPTPPSFKSSMLLGVGGDGTGNSSSIPGGGGGTDPDPGGGGNTGNDYDAIPPANAGAGKTWSRTFFDNFTGTTLDSSKWSHLYPWGAVSNGANGESQWYDESAVSVANSILTITATIDAETVYGYDYDYKAGLIQTYNKFSQRYGYWDAKLKFPAGQGFWPAFWTLQNSSAFPWPPELDIIEQLGSEPYDYHATVHTVDNSGNYSQWPNTKTASRPFTEWHIIGMHWTSTFIDWYLDNVFWLRLTPDPTFVIPSVAMYTILNYAVGGNWPGYPNGQTVFPSYFQVDWVRTYAAV